MSDILDLSNDQMEDVPELVLADANEEYEIRIISVNKDKKEIEVSVSSMTLRLKSERIIAVLKSKPNPADKAQYHRTPKPFRQIGKTKPGDA
jgi:hypothetical protein